MTTRLLLLACIVLCAGGTTYAQVSWNVVWTMDQLPFLDPDIVSEMAIVKAGFDTDEDGWGEFLCSWTDLDSNYVLMYEATADNTYDLVWYWKHPVQANSFAGITVGDLDNNGTVEIIVTLPSDVTVAPNPPRLWVFEWNGVQGENKYGTEVGGVVQHTTLWNFNLPDNTDFRPYSLTIEDIDKDGDNELIMGVRQGDRGREVMVVSVAGEFSSFFSWNIEFNYQNSFGGSLYSVTTGDLDNDGNQEIYALVWDLFTMRIFECTGDAQYTEVFAVDNLYGGQGIDYGALDGVRVADANNDGMKEMYIAGTEDPNKIFIVTGISDISQMDSTDIKELFTVPIVGPSSRGGFRSMQIADPDNDGNIDLMIAGEKNGQIYSLEYKGTGDPADSASWDLHILFDMWTYGSQDPNTFDVNKPRFFYGSPADDMDKDGKPEYVFVNYSTNLAVWPDDAYVWVIETDVATNVAEQSGEIPSTYRLLQNYPNPFNPSTTIAYTLPVRSKVRVELFNMSGQRVATLVNGEEPAGFRTVSWTPAQPSGTYFYRLEAVSVDDPEQQFVDVKKMILLK